MENDYGGPDKRSHRTFFSQVIVGVVLAVAVIGVLLLLLKSH
jgi:hypothetical protein